MKKIIALILAAVLAAVLVIPAFAEGESESPEKETEAVSGGEDGEPILTTGSDGAETESGKEDADAGEDGEPVLAIGAEEESDSSTVPAVISAEGAPDYTVKSDEYYSEYDFSAIFDDDGHFRDLKALDYVNLRAYDPLRITKQEIANEAEKRIKALLERYAEPEQLTDKTVENGDTVNIDYVGSVDGVEFEGGSTNGSGTDVTIGETQYIDGFFKQLIGHNPGEKLNVEVTFPDEYPNNPDLAGKDAVFAVTINYVHGENVVPELTDEWVKKVITPQNADIATAESLKNYYLESDAVKSSCISDKLISENKIENLPDEVYAFAVDLILVPLYQQAKSYGMDVDVILQYYGTTIEDVVKDYAEDNLRVAKRMLIVQAIDEKRDDVTVTEDDLVKFAKDNMDSDDYTEAVDMYGIGLYKMYVLQDVVMNYVESHAEVTEGFPTNYVIIGACVLAAVILAVVLVIVLGKRKKDVPVEAVGEDEGTDAPELITLNDVLDDVPDAEADADPTEEEDAPVDADLPEEDIPEEISAEEIPAEEIPAEDVPAEDAPAEEIPAEDVPADDVPAEAGDAAEEPGEEN